MEATSFLSNLAPPSFIDACRFSPLSSPIIKTTHKLGPRICTIRAADDSKKALPYSNYAVRLDNNPLSSCITRPLAEILRDLNLRVPDQVLQVTVDEGVPLKYIPWYHANRLLSFYAPGWCGEVRNVTYSSDGRSVTVVYRVTIRGSDGEAYRESSGTVLMSDGEFGDAAQQAEAVAFQRACARFGLGLYLYHENDTK